MKVDSVVAFSYFVFVWRIMRIFLDTQTQIFEDPQSQVITVYQFNIMKNDVILIKIIIN